MADEETPEATPQLSDSDSSEDESEEARVESLVAGRERRKTAGNRYDRDMILEEAPAEDEPDEVTLLFADNEGEEDEEFKSDEAEDEGDMSSSDDDDQGPAAGADDLEGEKDIQKQAKAERSKKRKADLALTSVAGLKKKLKTDPTKPAGPAVQLNPSKKKERVTWVHAEESGRGFLRKQTIAHRAETIARLKESEAQSKKLKAIKEKRERERAKDAPKELTQADRLAEAARIERQNAKSLNRWEAMEKKRVEEQAARLAALKNRKLEGPVVSWWSAKAKWIGPRLNKIGTKDAGDVIEGGTETKKRGRKSKAFHEQMQAAKGAELGTMPAGQTGTGNIPEVPVPTPISLDLAQASAGGGNVPQAEQEQTPMPTDENNGVQQQATVVAPSEPGDSFLRGIHEYAIMQDPGLKTDPSEAMQQTSGEQPLNVDGHESNEKAVSETRELEGMQPDEAKVETQTPTQAPLGDEISNVTAAEGNAAAQTDSVPRADRFEVIRQEDEILAPQETVQTTTDEQVLSDAKPATQSGINPNQGSNSTAVPEERSVPQATTPDIPMPDVEAQPPAPPPHPIQALAPNQVSNHGQTDAPKPHEGSMVNHAPEPEQPVEYSTRNLVILENFDDLSNKDKGDYTLFFNTRKSSKPVKHNQELCPITTLPVRYRDPLTGIGYANMLAYKKLQELKQHQFAWSSMLGCYVGKREGVVARGVPEGFVLK